MNFNRSDTELHEFFTNITDLNDLVLAIIRAFYSDVEEVILLDIIRKTTCSFESLCETTQFNENILRSSLEFLIRHKLLSKVDSINFTEKEFEENQNASKKKKSGKKSVIYYFIPYSEILDTIEKRLKMLRDEMEWCDDKTEEFKCLNCNKRYTTLEYSQMVTQNFEGLCSDCCFSAFRKHPRELNNEDKKDEQFKKIRLRNMSTEVAEKRATLFQLKNEFEELLSNKNAIGKNTSIGDLIKHCKLVQKSSNLRKIDANFIKDVITYNLEKNKNTVNFIITTSSEKEYTSKDILNSFLEKEYPYDLGKLNREIMMLKSSYCPFGKTPRNYQVDNNDDEDDDDDSIDWEDG